MDGRRSRRLAHRGLLTPALRRPALLLSSRQPRLKKKKKQEEVRKEAKEEEDRKEAKKYAGLLCALGSQSQHRPPPQKKQDGFSHLSSCRRLPSLHCANKKTGAR